MSHVAAAGSVTIGNNVAGKRLGVKKYAGEQVKVGNILVKQRGTVFHPGKNVKLSKDFSIYAVAEGVVAFRRMSGRKRGQYYVDVLNEEQQKAALKSAKASTEKTSKKPVKKVAVKTTKKASK